MRFDSELHINFGGKFPCGVILICYFSASLLRLAVEGYVWIIVSIKIWFFNDFYKFILKYKIVLSHVRAKSSRPYRKARSLNDWSSRVLRSIRVFHSNRLFNTAIFNKLQTDISMCLPAYEIGELNCRRFCHSHVSRSWLISPDGCKWRTCTQKETQCLNAPQSGALLKWNKCPGGQGYFPRVENLAIIRFALARKIRPLKNQSKFWSRLTFLNKRLILLRSLKNCSGEILWKFPTSGTGVGDS